VSLEQILKEESEAAKRGRMRRGDKYQGVDWKSKNFIKRTFEDVAEKTLKITDKCHFQTDMKNSSIRGDGVINAKKKRMRRFIESEKLRDDQSESKTRNRDGTKSK
jgi:hypothetical protein